MYRRASVHSTKIDRVAKDLEKVIQQLDEEISKQQDNLDIDDRLDNHLSQTKKQHNKKEKDKNQYKASKFRSFIQIHIKIY